MNANTQQVVLENRGQVVLRPTDHLATGGEGSVYRLNDTVVKVFIDPQKMKRDDMTDKIHTLAKICHPWIHAPRGLVFDKHNQPIGYYGLYAPGEGLPRFFTNDYRAQVGFGDDEASVLVDRMLEVVSIAHDNKATIVDGNEYGWIADYKKGSKPEPHIVDVDSWAIDRWKASVIMPSIIDHHTRGFNSFSDWFSWGVVTFQLYTGIHPYKGLLAGFGKHDFTTRMKKNASVFAPGVRLNRVVRDFSCIPSRLRDWYVDEFQHGKRSLPPSPFDTGVTATPSIVVQRVVVGQTTGSIKFDRLTNLTVGEHILKVFFCGAALTKSNRLIDLETSKVIASSETPECEVVKTPAGWFIAERRLGKTEFYFSEGNNHKELLNLNLVTSGIFRYQNRIFAVMKEGITELKLEKFATPILAIGTTWQALTSSTKWFDGVGIQDALGASYIIAPHGEGRLSYIRARELDGMRPVTARGGERFITVVAADRKGELYRLEFTFDKEYVSYKLTREEVDTPELVLAILPKGVVATIQKDCELKIFVPCATERLIADRTISTDEPFFAWGNIVVLVRGGNAWKITVA